LLEDRVYTCNAPPPNKLSPRFINKAINHPYIIRDLISKEKEIRFAGATTQTSPKKPKKEEQAQAEA
jgi:hypothetical protein